LIPKLADSTPTINDDDADNQHDITTSASEHLNEATKQPQGQVRSCDTLEISCIPTKQLIHLNHKKTHHRDDNPTTNPTPPPKLTTMSSDQSQQPSLIGGHAQYVKGAAEVHILPPIFPPKPPN
jgi:hypothetical protein